VTLYGIGCVTNVQLPVDDAEQCVDGAGTALVALDDWPRTGSGKVKKAELRDTALRELAAQQP
jgi:hypothetical protein